MSRAHACRRAGNDIVAPKTTRAREREREREIKGARNPVRAVHAGERKNTNERTPRGCRGAAACQGQGGAVCSREPFEKEGGKIGGGLKIKCWIDCGLKMTLV